MIRSIEGLRGVAALMVVFFHAFVLARWGGAPAQWGLVQNAWLFVDLFFVISGAIMAMVYGQRLQDGRQVRAFFIKRFFRLYPLHLVTTLTAIGAVIVVQGAKWAAAQAGIQLGGEQPFAVEFFKLSYFLLELVMLQGVGIMTEALHNYPSWSLSVEFWLYLAFAVLFFFVRSTRARVWASVAIVVLCLDHFLRVFSGLGPQVLAPDVHGMPRGLLSFFIGVLVWYGWQAVQPRLRNLSSPVLGACQLVLAVLSLALIDMRADLGAWVYAIPFVFGLWVWSLLPDRGVVAAFLQTPPLQWLGVHSYSIYLVHVTVLTFFDWPGRKFGEPLKYAVVAVFVLAVLLARWLAPSLGLSDMIIMLVGLAAFIGHLYPVFHGFKGGKGVATAGGVLLALNPLHGLAVLATWLAVAFLTRYSSLAAITAAFMAPIYWQLFYGIDARALVILLIAALLVWRHRENINRLLKGKESKIGGNKAPKPPKVKYPPPRVGGH